MFNLETPWFLMLIPLPIIFRWLLPAPTVKETAALYVPFFNRLQDINLTPTPILKKIFPKKLLLPFLIWCLLCLALSDPQWLGKPFQSIESGRDIMLALDLSGSMQTPDMKLHGHYYNRLAAVKIAARKFIEARTGDRLGLILFGTHAYLQTPLTFDQQTVLQMLDDATIGLAGTQTAIGDAIGLALKQLSQASGHSKVLILLTDGGNNAGVVSPLNAALMAKKLGVKIFTIGIGANELTVPGIFGPEIIHPTSAVDEIALQKIAAETNGLFFRADSGAALQQVYQTINQLVPVVSANTLLHPIQPLYPWPLGLALLLSFYFIFGTTKNYSRNITGEKS